MTIAILGAGGHGRDIAGIAEACGYSYQFYDDQLDGFLGCDKVTSPYVVGVNEPGARKLLAESVDPEIVPFSLVDPTGTRHRLSVHQFGVVVGAGTHMGPAVYLGDHVHVGAGCTITRTSVEDFATIGPGCDIAGDVTIGEGAFLGVGVVVKNLVRIGAWSRIGAGSVVVDDVPDGATVKGVPAR